ncbi:MAG: hypothetical protein FJ285_01705 [Planctomycetes bacterium]|nr:hypothetical protein [Planctomycetota bacterium]
MHMAKRRAREMAAGLLCGFLCTPAVCADSVVRVWLDSIRDVRTMESLSDDMWSHGIYGGCAEYLVTPEQREALGRTNLKWCVFIEDVESLVRAEHDRLSRPPQEGGVADDAWFSDFKNLAAIEARLEALVALRPDRASLFTVGTSIEGRVIRGIRISALPVGTVAPAVVLNGTQHAREWGATMTCMYMADRLVETADSDPVVAQILARTEVLVIPVVNVDGYVFTWADTANRLWRKNRRNNGDGTFGVDPNRNWGYQWGGAGASSNPSSETYRGPDAFSEPETQAMRTFFEARPNIVSNIDIHAYSQLVLSPWAYTTDFSADADVFQSIGSDMSSAITQSGGLNYTVGPAGTTLYLASGGSVDWVYGSRAALAWTTEVRDTGGYGFVMPPSEILPCARENFAATLVFLDRTTRAAAIVPQVAPPTIVAGTPTTITAKIRPSLAGSVSARVLRWRVGSGAWNNVVMSSLGNNLFAASLPAFPCGTSVSWHLLAVGIPVDAVWPSNGVEQPFQSVAASEVVLTSVDFESAPGWSFGISGDTATGGVWTQGDPIATSAQAEDDHSPAPGTQCAFTGQGVVGGGAGAADVDGGTTTLQSPSLGTMTAAMELRFWYWYSNNLGASPNQDEMPVQVQGSGGVWTTIATISSSQTAWREMRLPLNGVVPIGSPVAVRFLAQDLGAGSLVEAAVDDVQLVRLGCLFAPADFDNSGSVDGIDLAVLLSQWGSSGNADINSDGTVGGPDLTLLLASWG